MDGDLICNFKKCRKSLCKHAWVTSCSHIFCEEDGAREFNKAYTCPACESSLSGTFDIIRIDLQPSDQYKSMVLAGQKPEIIMEVCTRALSFWTYQTFLRLFLEFYHNNLVGLCHAMHKSHQERIYQEYVATKVKEKASQLEKYYEEIVSRIQSELNSLKLQHTTTKKEMESTKKKYCEVSEKLMEKSRQCQKLQAMYDALRRKLITPINCEEELQERLDSNNNGLRRENFILPLNSADSILRKQHTPPNTVNNDVYADNFVFEPNHTPVAGVFHNVKNQKRK